MRTPGCYLDVQGIRGIGREGQPQGLPAGAVSGALRDTGSFTEHLLHHPPSREQLELGLGQSLQCKLGSTSSAKRGPAPFQVYGFHIHSGD